MVEAHNLLGNRRATLLSLSHTVKQILVEGEGGVEAAQEGADGLHQISGITVHRPHLLYHAGCQVILLGIDGVDGAGYTGGRAQRGGH